MEGMRAVGIGDTYNRSTAVYGNAVAEGIGTRAQALLSTANEGMGVYYNVLALWLKA